MNNNIEITNLISVVEDILSKKVSLAMRDKFMNDPSIVEAMDHPALYQRVFINKFFIKELLSYRARNNVPVYDIITYLHNDGTINDWAISFSNYVFPFLRDNFSTGV